jgi:hypothetical protein
LKKKEKKLKKNLGGEKMYNNKRIKYNGVIGPACLEPEKTWRDYMKLGALALAASAIGIVGGGALAELCLSLQKEKPAVTRPAPQKVHKIMPVKTLDDVKDHPHLDDGSDGDDHGGDCGGRDSIHW